MKILYQIVVHTILAYSLLFSYSYHSALEICQNSTQHKTEKVKRITTLIDSAVPDKALTARYTAYYVKYGTEFNIDPALLAVVGRFESGYNASAVSDMGAIGIQQIMPFWVKFIPFLNSVVDLYDPALNIRASAYILSHYRELCGDSVESMAACYHGGPGARSNPKPSTQKFKAVVSNLFYEIKGTTYISSI